jgi:hypothetical protein
VTQNKELHRMIPKVAGNMNPPMLYIQVSDSILGPLAVCLKIFLRDFVQSVQINTRMSHDSLISHSAQFIIPNYLLSNDINLEINLTHTVWNTKQVRF